MNETQDQIGDLENNIKKYPGRAATEKGLKKYEDNLRELKDNMKHNNIQNIGIREGEDRDHGIENLLKK